MRGANGHDLTPCARTALCVCLPGWGDISTVTTIGRRNQIPTAGWLLLSANGGSRLPTRAGRTPRRSWPSPRVRWLSGRRWRGFGCPGCPALSCAPIMVAGVPAPILQSLSCPSLLNLKSSVGLKSYTQVTTDMSSNGVAFLSINFFNCFLTLRIVILIHHLLLII